jgi:hypothetical protein
MIAASERRCYVRVDDEGNVCMRPLDHAGDHSRWADPPAELCRAQLEPELLEGDRTPTK